jgi:hypothetical protein
MARAGMTDAGSRVVTIGMNLTGSGIDEPDQNFYENFVCCAEGNYNAYCNPEIDKLIDRQPRRLARQIARRPVAVGGAVDGGGR